jgi:cytochrome b subunit of formate dehydrogenase
MKLITEVGLWLFIGQSLIGILLNCSLLSILNFTKQSNTEVGTMGAISFVDLIYSVCLLGFSVARFNFNFVVKPYDHYLCALSASVLPNVCMCSLDLITLLAIIRYLKASKDTTVSAWTLTPIIALVVGSTVIPAVAAAPFSAYMKLKSEIFCTYAPTPMLKILKMYMFFKFCICVITLIVCYIKVLISYRRSKKNKRVRFDTCGMNDETEKVGIILEAQSRITVRYTAVMGLYLLVLLPELGSAISYAAYPRPIDGWEEFAISFLEGFLVVINPIFVLVVHRETWAFILGTLAFKKRRKGRVHNVDYYQHVNPYNRFRY